MKEKTIALLLGGGALLGCLIVFAYFFGWPLYQEAAAAKDAEKKIAAAQVRVAADLIDPSSAQFRESRVGYGGEVCGQVNGKNAYGAYVGFRWFHVREGDGVTIDHPDAPIKLAEVLCARK